MRDVLDSTLKLSDDKFAEFANKINGQDILIIDDTISRGQSIKEACQIMLESYAPKSITVLTLLSRIVWLKTKCEVTNEKKNRKHYGWENESFGTSTTCIM